MTCTKAELEKLGPEELCALAATATEPTEAMTLTALAAKVEEIIEAMAEYGLLAAKPLIAEAEAIVATLY